MKKGGRYSPLSRFKQRKTPAGAGVSRSNPILAATSWRERQRSSGSAGGGPRITRTMVCHIKPAGEHSSPTSRRLIASSKSNPCPVCGRVKDGDCRASDLLVLCHRGTTHHPPAGLRPGVVITGRDGRPWAYGGESSDVAQRPGAEADWSSRHSGVANNQGPIQTNDLTSQWSGLMMNERGKHEPSE